ncbi:MAG: UDP-N-acetylmuramate dehydrogenase [Lachnospiraceae bacterium]|jgi:UDP-N-acetylmuramate dehydrogenase|nr:UDP-N-acetylmuramate dehydrogenase [Lachnospiraceae bacterium]
MKVLKNEPLDKHTSFRVGGPAKVYVVPEDEYELQKLIEFLHSEKLLYNIIGNGTNLLVSDEGVDSVVIEIGKALDGIEFVDGDGIYRIRALAGTSLGKTAQFAANHSLTGMEALRGIPGTVGGAVTMNAGAYGTEMKDVLESVEVVTKDGGLKKLPAAELKLGYRYSIVPEEGYVVVAATFALKKGDKKLIEAEMADYQQRRKDKQPIEKFSAGSTFKRPEGHFAGKLIEDCGLRGYKHGGAEVSEKHCGFVINDGTARAADIYWLIGEIRKIVLMEQGVMLTPEVKLWGNF